MPGSTPASKQTAAAHSDPADWLEELTVYCAMELAVGYYGATNRYGTFLWPVLPAGRTDMGRAGTLS